MPVEGVYYVRSRGRFTGPFDLAALQKMVQRGVLSRTHEISSDRATWTPASNYAELFPARQASTRPTARGGVEQPNAASPDAATPPQPTHAAAPTSTELYYYSQGGVNVGPLRAEVLKNLVKNGTVQADDVVWPEGSTMAIPARQVPMLAAMFSGSSLTSGESTNTNRSKLTVDISGISAFAGITGLIAGILILLLLNLPWVIVNGTPIWWWTAVFQVPSSIPATLCIFLLLFGVGLSVVSPLVRGVPRGIVFVIVTGVIGLVWLACALSSPSSGEALVAFFVWYGIPVITALVSASSRVRPRLHGVVAAQGIQMTAAIALLCMLVIVLIGVGQSANVVPPTLRPFFVAFTIALLAGLCSAIMAIVDAAKGSSRTVNLWATYCADGSLALQGLTMFLLISAVVREIPFERAMGGMLPTQIHRAAAASTAAIFMIRFWLLAFVPALLAAIGVAEILLSSYGSSGRPPKPLSRPTRQSATADALSHITE